MGQIKRDIAGIGKKWAGKNKVATRDLKGWMDAMYKECSDRIGRLAKVRNYDRPVLSDRACKRELEQLQEDFVITVVDKAANNFAFICRKFYFVKLAEELGLDKDNPGNDTYTFINETEDNICREICSDLLKYKITPKTEEIKLAILYQTPKFHKNPPKMRYIAGNIDTVLSQLDEVVAKILKMCKSHFQNLCNKYKNFSGVRYCFDVGTSGEVKQMFDNLGGNAETISINDFSTLYTLFDHDHLLSNISWLLSKLSKNKGMIFISVGHKGAWWSSKDSGKFPTYTLVEVVEMIEYLIRHTHIKAFGHIFRQDKGMIMGGKSSGWLSDCSLMVDEFKYIDGKVKSNNRTVAMYLKDFCRYRDDCTVCNYDNFPNITSEIYPPSLSLTQENDSNQSATVLDMDVRIVEGRFETKVYCKTDDFPFDVISLPFLESNINGRLCYLVFYGQVLRFQRLCTHRVGFESRTKLLADTLMGRGYDKVKLRVEFCRVVGKYLVEFQRWQLPANLPGWFNLILDPDNQRPADSQGPLDPYLANLSALSSHDETGSTDPPNDTSLISVGGVDPNPVFVNTNEPIPTNNPNIRPLTISLSQPNPLTVTIPQPADQNIITNQNSISQDTLMTRTLRPRKYINYKI